MTRTPADPLGIESDDREGVGQIMTHSQPFRKPRRYWSCGVVDT